MRLKVLLLFVFCTIICAQAQLLDKNIEIANTKLLSGDLEYSNKIASKLMNKYANDSTGLTFFYAGIIKAKCLYAVYRFKESAGLLQTLERKVPNNQNTLLQQQAYTLLAEQYIYTNDLVKGEELLKINPSPLNRTPNVLAVADYQLAWAKLYHKQGYNLRAIALLEAQLKFRKSMADTGKFLPKNTYFAAIATNKLWHIQKYAEVLFEQAEAESSYGNLHRADTLLNILIKTVATRLSKEHSLYIQANMLQADVYKELKQDQKSIDKCFIAYTAHNVHDYEPLKIKLLAKIIRKYYEIGIDIDGKNYLRRLQMFAIRNVGKKEPLQLAYECSEAIRLYTENNFIAAIERLESTLITFAFLPEAHADKQYIYALMAEIYYNQGNMPKYLTTTDVGIQLRKKYAGYTPTFHILKLEKASYLSKYGTDPKATKSTWDSSYYKVCAVQWHSSSPQKLKVLSALAVYFYRTGQVDSALSVQTRVANIAKTLFGEYSPYSMKEAVQLAEIQILKGKYKDAQSTLQQVETAVANATKGAKSVLVQSNIQIAKLNGLLGNLTKSKLYVHEAQIIHDDMKRSYFFTNLAYDDERATVNYETGNYFKAERTLSKLHTTAEGLGNKGQYLLFTTYLAQAKVSIVNGSFPKAEKLILSATACIKEGNLDFAKLQITNSEYFVAISDYKTALDKITLADNLVSTLLGINHLYRAETMSQKGYILSKLPNPDLKKIEALYFNAGTIISNALGVTNPLYINNLKKLAAFYMQVGLLDEAEKLLLESQKYWLATTGENNIHVADIKMLLGKIDYERAKYPNAYTHYEKAASIYKTIFNSKHPDYIKAQSQIARVYFMRKDVSKSLEIMEAIIPNYLEYTQKYFPTLSFRQKSKYWATLKEDFEFYTFLAIEKNAETKPKLRSDIYNLVISTKALLLSTDIKMRKQILNSKDTTLINIFNEWLAQKSLLTTALSLSKQEQQEQRISEDAITNTLEKLEKEMSAKSEIFNLREKNKRIVWQDIRNTLLSNETAVEMVRYRTFNKVPTDTVRYVALILKSTSGMYPEYVKMDNGTDMEKRYLKYYRNSTINRTVDEISYTNFWEPIKAKIPDGNVVYFSSEGVYNQINIETLRKSDNTFAIDKNDIVLVTNTKDLLINSNVPKDKNTSEVIDFVVCGNPKFYVDGTQTKQSVKELPGAAEEAQLVENVMSQAGKITIKLLSKYVTEDTLRNIKNPTIFHIATHGYFKETVPNANEQNFADNPLLNSGLMLSGSGDIVDNKTNQYINQKDGILTAYEAIDLNFEKTKLVVLSACETGRGQVEVGEGVFGLQRSFLVAGAHSIILSLFKVDDEATNLLMVSMYKRALFNGGDYRRAFKEAKNEVRNTSKFKDTIYWGAFIMVEGKPGRNVVN